MFGRPMRVSYESDVYGEEGLHREHDGDAGLDLRCAEPFTLPAHGTAFVSCGLTYVPVVADTADDLDVEGQRGEDGFGSTGLR